MDSRLPVGEAIVSLGVDGTHTREYFVRALDLNGTEVFPEHEAVGKLDRGQSDCTPPPPMEVELLSRVSRG